MNWWWCLKHKRVEQDAGCGSLTRLGPYDSAARAATALERVRARGDAQDARDQRDDAERGKR